jgi:hypothetical protein
METVTEAPIEVEQAETVAPMKVPAATIVTESPSQIPNVVPNEATPITIPVESKIISAITTPSTTMDATKREVESETPSKRNRESEPISSETQGSPVAKRIKVDSQPPKIPPSTPAMEPNEVVVVSNSQKINKIEYAVVYLEMLQNTLKNQKSLRAL